jgi:hypothetical protein
MMDFELSKERCRGELGESKTGVRDIELSLNAAVPCDLRALGMLAGGDPGLAGWGGRIRNRAFLMIVIEPESSASTRHQ